MKNKALGLFKVMGIYIVNWISAHYFPVGKIAKKAVCKSVFLTI